MRLYPAIDILDGNAVRLVQGDFAQRTEYAADPLEAALAWREAGAERLHVVDLDGARAGEPVNLDHVERIVRESGLSVQLGGGLRSPAALERAAAAGAERLVLGTAAFTDLLEGALARFGERIVVSIDVRGGKVSTAGWTETGSLAAADAARELRARGVRQFAYTDVDRDGMLAGGDVAGVRDVAAALGAECALIYSGGIGSLADLEALRSLPLAGVIVGKALYERRFTVAEATRALCI
ncbi:MAG: 1-(5-phosphoribosyl)-5-[(5-phosphoribosylamino) methylideneamino]imidazole-4-carboxamide isomerase [Solirubrobacteraceae bacterium]